MNPRFTPLLRPLALVALVVALGSLACAPPPLVEAPGADAVAVGRTADAVALAGSLAKAGLVSTGEPGLAAALAAAGPAMDATAPFIASHLPSGAVIVATRLSAGAASSPLASAASTPVIGQTAAIDLGGAPALVRRDRDRVLVGLFVPRGDEASVAALIEVMAAQKAAAADPELPAPRTVRLRVAGSAIPLATGDVDAVVTLAPDGALALEARAAHPNEALLASFRSDAPPWACPLSEGAAAWVAVPPVVVGQDAFRGRLVLALYPATGDHDRGPAFAVAGVPRDHAAAESLAASVQEAAGSALRASVVDGGGRAPDADAADLHARISDDAFLLTRGHAPAGASTAAGATPPTCGTRLVTVHGPALARVLLPVLATPADLLRALVGGDGGGAAQPFRKLLAVDELGVDVAPDAGGALTLSARLSLAKGAAAGGGQGS